MQRRPLRVGLTGGIGSGKTTVSQMFAELGVPVLDADEAAREVVAPGSPAWREIRDAFGPQVLDADGHIARDRLRAIVFADAHRRRELEAITHPRILDLLERRVRALRAPYCVLAIPLLAEGGLTEHVDRVLVVDAAQHLQIERVTARDGLTAAQVKAIMDTQASRRDRLAIANDVITNDGDRESLRAQVAALHQRYLALAAEPQSDDHA